MAKKIVKTQLLLRNDQRSNFAADKVYGKAEPIVVWETDGTATLLVGDGTTAFKDLTGIGLTAEQAEKLSGVEAGAQVNVIESVSVNGVAVEITDKGVNITVPTKVSELTNDSKFQTEDQVAAAIAKAISESGHASFVKVDAVPAPADAEANVLYLVMNAATNHYDIYAKVGEEIVLLDDTTVDLSGYVEKEADKGLSANDYTDADKAKVDGVSEGANKVEASATNGNVKVDGQEVGVYTLPDTVLDSGDTLVFDCGNASA